VTPHDNEVDRLGLLIIAVVAVMTVSGLVALMSDGMAWLLPIAILVSITSVAALMWMFARITGPDDHHGEPEPTSHPPADRPVAPGRERSAP
jgi:hypothetical protein